MVKQRLQEALKANTVILLLWLACSSASLEGLPHRGDKIVYEWKSKDFFIQRIAVSGADFEPRRLEAYFERYLRTPYLRHKLVDVSVYVDEKEARNGNAKSVTDVTYELWANLYEDYRRGVPPMAELLVLNGAAIMRVRSLDGTVSRKILKLTDPLNFKTEHHSFEIIHFTLLHQLHKVVPRFFLIGLVPISKDGAMEATEYIANLLKLNEVSVEIRLDPWFITEETFPVTYVFQSAFNPPSAETYKVSPQVGCWLENKVLKCHGGSKGSQE
jgi:hypothetical protein